MQTSPVTAVLFLLLLFATVIRTSPPPAADFHQSDIALHQHHVSYITDFRCQYPQPRVVRIKDLLSDHLSYGKAYYPDITVLHHCDDGCGSCPSEQTCKPLHADFVRLPFKVTFLEGFGSYHRKGSWAWEYHDVANHTLCTCYHIRHYVEESLGSNTILHQKTTNGVDSDRLGDRMAEDDDAKQDATTVKPKDSSLTFPE